MDSQKKIVHKQTATGGMDTSTAIAYLKPDQYVYSLNCDVITSDDGNVGIISKPKGNIKVEVPLPQGRNKCIGVCRDEEYNKLYFAVWNSLGYHSWFQFDYTSTTVKLIIQNLTNTDDNPVFRWKEDSVILHSNVVKGDLLYWTCSGDEARMVSIKKCIDKSDSGYGDVITDEYTRAFKRPPSIAPDAKYADDTTVSKNSVFGYLFKFAYQYIYDQGEESTFSDFSKVPLPIDENGIQTTGIPTKNNVILVNIFTGNKNVKKIRIVAKKTNQEGGESDWVVVEVIDKDKDGITSGSMYEYRFYNNSSYLNIDNSKVLLAQSLLPRMPELQAFTGKAMVYGNFPVGRPIFDVDFNVGLSYSDLFFDSPVTEESNSPFMSVTTISETYEDKSGWFSGGYRVAEMELVVGGDVRQGNVFELVLRNDNPWSYLKYNYFRFAVTATALSNAHSIVSDFIKQFSELNEIARGSIGEIQSSGVGGAKVRFVSKNAGSAGYMKVDSVTYKPVTYLSLKNTGASVLNEKMGGVFRYAIGYEDEDLRKSQVQTNGQLVEVAHINQLGGIKKVDTRITINNEPPEWATKLVVYRTKNLNQDDYIQLLIQKIVKTVESTIGEEYYDLSITSLYNYQKINDSVSLKYEFKKGDRIRFLKKVTAATEEVITDSLDFEVLNFFEEVKTEQLFNVEVNGTIRVKTTVDIGNIGNNIIIDGSERVIIDANATTGEYILNSAIGTSSTTQIYNSYEIVNRGGVLRIKADNNIISYISDTVFPVVEVYNPYQNLVSSELENYYVIAKFDITNGFHRGNIQDQDASRPAIISVQGVDNYVKNRGLITNNSEKNPNIYVSLVEDKSFSDFYVSDLSSLGRVNAEDNSKGEVLFNERLVWSSNYIEDTNINGLNMFLPLNRVDYNDSYGSIMRIMSHEGRMYIFKRLKTGWSPIYGRIIQDQNEQQFLAVSDNLLPDKMEYFLWEGGVADNPESVVRDGNDIFGISTNSGVIFDIGGNGVLPISKIFNLDNEARTLLSEIASSGIKAFGGFNSKKDEYVLNVPAYRKVAYRDVFSSSNWKPVLKNTSGNYVISENPVLGAVSISGTDLAYGAFSGVSGLDSFTIMDSTTLETTTVNILVVPEEDGISNPYKVVAGQTLLFAVGELFLSTGWTISDSIASHISSIEGSIENFVFVPEVGKTYLIGVEKSLGSLTVSLGGNSVLIAEDGYTEVYIEAEDDSPIVLTSAASLTIYDFTVFGEFKDSTTLKFNDRGKQFSGYCSYSGDILTKFFDDFISFKNGELWVHDKNERRCNYYGIDHPSVFTFYANTVAGLDKDFYSILLDSNKPWRVDIEIPSTILRKRGQRSRIKPQNFKYEKNNFVADFMRDMNDTRFGTELKALLKGAFLQGKFAKITLTNSDTDEVHLTSVEVYMSVK